MSCKISCLLISGCALIFSGCAGSYHPVIVKNLSYASVAETDEATMSYKYDILRQFGNKKYPKKEIAKNIRVIAVEFTNNSDRPINFKDDVEISSGPRTIIPLDPIYARKELKQIAPLYLLWALLWINISKCDAYDCENTPIPVGAVIGLYNMAKAGSANKHLFEDLTRYNMLNKTIDPGETVSGLITIAAESGQPLQIRIK